MCFQVVLGNKQYYIYVVLFQRTLESRLKFQQQYANESLSLVLHIGKNTKLSVNSFDSGKELVFGHIYLFVDIFTDLDQIIWVDSVIGLGQIEQILITNDLVERLRDELIFDAVHAVTIYFRVTTFGC